VLTSSTFSTPVPTTVAFVCDHRHRSNFARADNPSRPIDRTTTNGRTLQ
jgi:hypothetical protein